jgi:hypothetical protein
MSICTRGLALRRIAFACLFASAVFATEAEAQRGNRGGSLLRLNGAGLYTGAFGGTGPGFQISMAVPVPFSFLGAEYAAGVQFWYSQPSLSGITIGTTERQLFGYGGFLAATWSISDRVFPYVRIPVQGVTSKVPVPSAGFASSSVSLPPQNQPGTASSFAIGIGGGVTVTVGNAFGVYGGATTLANRLYANNSQPIWSLELGIILSPGAKAQQ